MQDVKTLITQTIHTDWRPTLLNLLTPQDEEKINKIFKLASEGLPILPDPHTNIFRAFTYFNIAETKAVIIGQDCYPNKNHAMGLAFSVPPLTKPIPPSLRNIYKEITASLNLEPKSPSLEHWATQNVLLLNTALTVQESTPGSHIQHWSNYTKSIIHHIATTQKNIVYFLWGAHAQSFECLISTQDNLILKWSHPSPLSRKPFVGNNHFKLCNEYLAKHGKSVIEWA